ncbi:MAG: hypothetical protein J6Y19_10485 [Kiritimatiellae bacterium]|nr:hypothetical protein [Kiritimatiellia bacterium]
MIKKPWNKTIALLGAICLMASALPAHALSMKQPTASKGKYASYVYLTWPSSSLGRKGYNVYRTPTAKFANATLLGRTSSLRWADRTAASGRKYWYWVEPRGYHLIKGQTAGSAQGGYRTVFIPRPSVARGKSSTSLYVKWTASPQSRNGYKVYRSTSASFSSATLVATTKNRYVYDKTATPGRSYYYWIGVRGYNVVFYNSSKGYQGWMCLSVPTPDATVYAAGSAQLTWASSRGATKYKVYWSTSSSWSSAQYLNTTTGRSMYVYNMTPGVRYYFWVSPVDVEGDAWYRASGWVSFVAQAAEKIQAPYLTPTV